MIAAMLLPLVSENSNVIGCADTLSQRRVPQITDEGAILHYERRFE